VALGLAVAIPLALPAAAGAFTQTFNFTGAAQTFTVPTGVTLVTVDAFGAEGGQAQDGTAGGLGGRATATIAVTAGQVLQVNVGGRPATGNPAAGGFNGGGASGTAVGGTSGGGGGGGASDVRQGGTGLADRVVVAGGGGGGGGNSGPCTGGSGGGATGGDGSPCSNLEGHGGTQSQGGAAGNFGGGAGGSGTGGAGGSSSGGLNVRGGGGGGGGLFGGGGGSGFSNSTYAGGGGGGSGFTPTGTGMTNGVRTGNGQVVIAYTFTPTLTTSASANITLGGSVHDTATLAGGSAATGTITFRLYGPNDAGCSATPAFTDTMPVSGNGPYDSASFTPTAAGTYRWTASYGGDSNNNAVAGACNDANESVAVSPLPLAPTIEITSVARDRRQGTATLTVEVNSPGLVSIAQTKNVKSTDPIALAEAGTAELEVAASGHAARTLRRKGRVDVNPRAIFLPESGGKFGKRQPVTLLFD
jgi:hypothetical protein